MARDEPPAGGRVTYSRQYRRCGKPDCPRCGPGGPGHGPYWYAFWREGGRVRSRYLGVQPPAATVAIVDRVPVPPARPSPPLGGDGAVPAAAPPLRVRTLGAFVVARADVPLPAGRWERRTVGALFKALLGAPGQTLPRERVLDLLWPALPPARAAATLRVTLHRLRAALAPPGVPGATSYVRVADDTLTLVPAPGGTPEPGWLDADAFAAAAATALAGVDAPACWAALTLYGGDYLPEDPYAEWALARRAELRSLCHALLLHLARLEAAREAEGPAARRAARALRTLLAADPCHEEAARLLMHLLARDGQRVAALRVYDLLARALRDELAVAPAPLTGFVGRGRALAALDHALRRPGPTGRLITLTGPGGVGKSRLALEVARDILPAYPDGVWLVELAALREPARLPEAVAAALGLGAAPGCTVGAALVAALRGRRLLLVLDSCEHLRAACAALALRLLPACPEIRLLATSRVALGLTGETVWLVPPLALPPPEAADGPDVGSAAGRAAPADTARGAEALARLSRVEAVRLFVARAHAVRPDFALTPANAAAVVRLCRQLDGLPLALELAAARAATLTVPQIAARLAAPGGLRTSRRLAAPARHRTLGTVLDGSYALLRPAERTLLRRLAVFAGGWTLEAAAAVGAGVAPAPAGVEGAVAPGAVADLLEGLEAQSLVTRLGPPADAETAGAAGERYGLLETIRADALERLAACGERPALERTHAAYYLEMAERAAPALTGPAQAAWLARLAAERANLRVALGWARGPGGDPTLGLRLAAALDHFWAIGGAWEEGARHLEAALAAVVPQPAVPRARAMLSLGRLRSHQGRWAAAMAALEAALAAARAREDVRGAAEALILQGYVALRRGDGAGGMARLEESLALARRAGDAWLEASALYLRGLHAARQGDDARAEAWLAQGLARARPSGDARLSGLLLHALGALAQRQGDDGRAAGLLGESLACARAAGARQAVANALAGLGRVALRRGQAAPALAALAEAIALFDAVHDDAHAATTLELLTEAARRAGRARDGAYLLGAAQARRTALGLERTPEERASYERAVAEGQAALGAEAHATAWAAGGAMAWADALALVRALAGGTVQLTGQ